MQKTEKDDIQTILYRRQFELKIPIWEYFLNQKRWLKIAILFFILTSIFDLDYLEVCAWIGGIILVVYNLFYHQNSLTSPIG